MAGSALGGLLGGMIGGGGGGPASFTGYSVSGSMSRAGASGSATAHSANSEDAFSWYAGNLSQLLGGGLQQVNNLIGPALDEVTKLAGKLGADVSGAAGFSGSFSLSGLTEDNKVQAVMGAVGQVADQLANKLVPGLAKFAQAGESAAQTLTRLGAAQDQATASAQSFVRGLPGALGVTSLTNYRNSLSVSDTLAPTDRIAAARGILGDTYSRAMAGDLTAVNAFPGAAQSVLSIGRDSFASGPQFAALFKEVNRDLSDILQNQQSLQSDLLSDLDLSIQKSSNDQIDELRKMKAAIVAGLSDVRAAVRAIAA